MSRVDAITTNLDSSSAAGLQFTRDKLRRGECVLVEDGDTAQFPAIPFGLVLMKLGVDRLEERAHEGNLVRGTDDRALEVVVLDYMRPR